MKRLMILVFLGVQAAACAGPTFREDNPLTEIANVIDSHIEQGKYYYRSGNYVAAAQELATAHQQIEAIHGRLASASGCYGECARERAQFMQGLREVAESVETYTGLALTELHVERWQAAASNSSVQSMCQGMTYVLTRVGNIEESDRDRVVNLMKRVILIVDNTPNTDTCRANLSQVLQALGVTTV